VCSRVAQAAVQRFGRRLQRAPLHAPPWRADAEKENLDGKGKGPARAEGAAAGGGGGSDEDEDGGSEDGAGGEEEEEEEEGDDQLAWRMLEVARTIWTAAGAGRHLAELAGGAARRASSKAALSSQDLCCTCGPHMRQGPAEPCAFHCWDTTPACWNARGGSRGAVSAASAHHTGLSCSKRGVPLTCLTSSSRARSDSR